MRNPWNIADAIEALAQRFPDEPAVLTHSEVNTWSDLQNDATTLAAALARHRSLRLRLGNGGNIGICLRNSYEYITSLIAAFKLDVSPINTNYRYRAAELAALWRDADVEVVIFDDEFVSEVAEVRDMCRSIKLFVWLGPREMDCPRWAVSYGEVLDYGRALSDAVTGGGRSGDSIMLLYTGGTTGAPKGVMWRHEDLLRSLNALGPRSTHIGGSRDVAEWASRIGGPAYRCLPGSPLMHGTGLFHSLTCLLAGGSVVLMESKSLDVNLLLDLVERHSVNSLSIVGDSFAIPILRNLVGQPRHLSSLRVIFSSGAVLSASSKEALSAALPHVSVIDALGSSEAVGVAASTTQTDDFGNAGFFTPGPNTVVIDDFGNIIPKGQIGQGKIAVTGPGPIGYYKDPVKTASTFVQINGTQYTILGDYVDQEETGRVRFIGRGSMCINTAGEKVYPEEVEEAAKAHPYVDDAIVVGAADPIFGQCVAAVLQPSESCLGLELSEVESVIRERLASYKVPRVWSVVQSLDRGPNGKLDYQRWSEHVNDPG